MSVFIVFAVHAILPVKMPCQLTFLDILSRTQEQTSDKANNARYNEKVSSSKLV